MTIVKGLKYPKEAYYTLPGSLAIINSILSGQQLPIAATIKKYTKQCRNKSLEEAVNIMTLRANDLARGNIVILETATGYVARFRLDDKILPLREDGLENANVLQAIKNNKVVMEL